MKRNLLQPRPMRLDLVRQLAELPPDDLIIRERFPERVPFVRVGDAVGEAGAGFAVAADGHDEAFLVEILHDDLEAGVFLAQEVFHGDNHVVQFDHGTAARVLPAVVDLAAGDAFGVHGDHEDGDAFHSGAAGADGCGHVGGPGGAGDPFLPAVDEVGFPVGRFYGGGEDVADIAAAAGFGDAEAEGSLPLEETGEPFVLLSFRAVVDDWGYANYGAASQARSDTAFHAGCLIRHDHEVEYVQFIN